MDADNQKILYNQYIDRPKVLVPVILFVLTVITTMASGALFEGIDIFEHPGKILHGAPFSLSLLLILGTHELGHYIASRRHGVITTLPMFIPAPPIPPMIGTFGAVIRIKSPISTKNELVDIGASGPLAGFVIALIVTAIGLKYSTVVPVAYSHASQLGSSLILILPTAYSGGYIGVGSSIIFKALSYLMLGPVPVGSGLILHPVAFAGWIGFFITAMNLLPLGQLDGGHIIYAIIGREHRRFSIAMVGFLVALGLWQWPGWIVWAVLISIIGLRHPSIEDQHIPMDSGRKRTTAAALIVFALTFIPTPFYIV
jgi:membrane-associated protease RseP (regulator of RpoE activity)